MGGQHIFLNHRKYFYSSSIQGFGRRLPFFFLPIIVDEVPMRFIREPVMYRKERMWWLSDLSNNKKGTMLQNEMWVKMRPIHIKDFFLVEEKKEKVPLDVAQPQVHFSFSSFSYNILYSNVS